MLALLVNFLAGSDDIRTLSFGPTMESRLPHSEFGKGCRDVKNCMTNSDHLFSYFTMMWQVLSSEAYFRI